MRNKLFWVGAVLFAAVWASCHGLRTRNSPEFLAEQPGAVDPAERVYETATEHFYREDYDEARRVWLDLIEEHPASPAARRATFRIAECLFLTEDYQNGAVYYQRYLDQDADASFVHDARARLNQCLRRGASGFEALTEESAGSDRLAAVLVPVMAGRDLEEVSREITYLAQVGFNAIILRVFHREGHPFHGPVPEPGAPSGVYFRTGHAPVVHDLLNDVARVCRERGMRIFAWMTTREADYGWENRQDLACRRYDPATGRIVPGQGLNLFHPAVEERLVGLIRDLAANDIDGILLHDDLLLRDDEGFSDQARAVYERRFGRALDPARLFLRIETDEGGVPRVSEYGGEFWDFVRMKCDRIVELQVLLAMQAKRIRPTLRFGVSFMYEVASDFHHSRAWLSQDLVRSREAGFDYYAIAAYQSQIAREQSLTSARTLDFIERIARRAMILAGRPERALFKFQLVDWEEERMLGSEEVAAVLDRVLGDEIPSVAFFPYQPSYPFDEIRSQVARLNVRRPAMEADDGIEED